mmetsp:Transcript_11954/g.27716  ORF Transcript_11954/g.27716 Transcript_11954/m.27716 type:complete len:86 (-) Transcript_11954:920-1177(-)
MLFYKRMVQPIQSKLVLQQFPIEKERDTRPRFIAVLVLGSPAPNSKNPVPFSRSGNMGGLVGSLVPMAQSDPIRSDWLFWSSPCA